VIFMSGDGGVLCKTGVVLCVCIVSVSRVMVML
jgi:hypothetical protein